MVPEQVIVLLTNENIDLCCVAIEKAAMDRAMTDVDEGFTAAFEARRRHREVSNISVLRRMIVFKSSPIAPVWSALLGCNESPYQLFCKSP